MIGLWENEGKLGREKGCFFLPEMKRGNTNNKSPKGMALLLCY